MSYVTELFLLLRVESDVFGLIAQWLGQVIDEFDDVKFNCAAFVVLMSVVRYLFRTMRLDTVLAAQMAAGFEPDFVVIVPAFVTGAAVLQVRQCADLLKQIEFKTFHCQEMLVGFAQFV